MSESIILTGFLGIGSYAISRLFGSMSAENNRKINDIKSAVKVSPHLFQEEGGPDQVYGYVESCTLETPSGFHSSGLSALWDGSNLVSREVLTHKVIRRTTSVFDEERKKNVYSISDANVLVHHDPLAFAHLICAKSKFFANLYSEAHPNLLVVNPEMYSLIPKLKLSSDFHQETTNQINVNQVNSTNPSNGYEPKEKFLGTKQTLYGFKTGHPVTILGNYLKSGHISAHPSKYTAISQKPLKEIRTGFEDAVSECNTAQNIFFVGSIILGICTGVQVNNLLSQVNNLWSNKDRR